MRYDELKRQGAEMPVQVWRDSLAGLSTDPRFAAVPAMLENLRRQFVVCGSDPKMSREVGPMAHAMGSVHAIEMIDGLIRDVVESKGDQQ